MPVTSCFRDPRIHTSSPLDRIIVVNMALPDWHWLKDHTQRDRDLAVNSLPLPPDVIQHIAGFAFFALNARTCRGIIRTSHGACLALMSSWIRGPALGIARSKYLEIIIMVLWNAALLVQHCQSTGGP